MRPTLLAAVSVISLLLMAIGVPQQASAAGKNDGTWAGKLKCYEIEFISNSTYQPVDGTEVLSNVKMIIRDNHVIGQSGFFSGKIGASDNEVNIKVTLPKLGPHSLAGKFLTADGVRAIQFQSGGESDDETECAFYLTRSGDALGQFASTKIKRSQPQHMASKVPSRPTPIKLSANQSSSSAGKFDGDWKGNLSCFEVDYSTSTSGGRPVEGSEVFSKVKLTVNGNKITNHLGFTPPNDQSLKSDIDVSKNQIRIQHVHPNLGRVSLEGKFINSSGERFLKFEGNTENERECEFTLTWSNNRPHQVATSSPEGASEATLERKRLQQEIAALRKAGKDRKAAEADRQRKAEAKRIAEIQRKQEEARKLAETERKRKAEVKRLADVERKRKAEVKRVAEAERKRKVEAKRLADSDRKRKTEAIRVAALQKKRKAAEEKKRKAAEEKKRKAAQQTASAVGGSGKLQQQLAVLKQLRANGLINKQQFETKQQALLNRFLGLGSVPSTKVARAVKPKNTELKKSLAKYSDVKFGTYHALVIGSNDYKYLPKLKTAKSDAKAVAKTLKSKYGYKVKTLLNATRIDILDAFDQYREVLTSSDNLLIYYAGHGYLDKKGDRGYWMPVDARPNRRSAWLSNADITDTLKALNAKHVMVMADSCYSGTLTRGLSIKERSPDYVREVVAKKARVVITSGGLEPVADKGGGNHSPFASVFLDVLNSNNGVLDGTKLFNKMRRPVMLKADQTPAYADVRKAGHEGGDFLFVRRR